MQISRKLWGSILVFVLLVSVLLPVRVQAGVNDFSIRSFEADYYLTRDDSSRSRMKVTEKIVAEFPQYDQNHGIERYIPEEYDGHTVSLEITAVKKENGQAWNYSTYGSNKNKVLRIGDADKYVHGVQTYVIEYTMRDVTKAFTDHDELFWDVNGTGWQQRFGSVTARLHLAGDVESAFTARSRCFSGREGATDICAITSEKTSEGTVLHFSPDRILYAGENMSFVAGFEKGTFAAYEPSTWERLLPSVLIVWLAISGLILVGMIGVLVHASRRYGRSAKGRGTIVPEYLPPKDMNVLVAANVLGKTAHATTAQIIDLAVRHYLKIYETETKGNWFRRKRTYELELVKTPANLTHEEHQIIDMVFGKGAHAGKRVTIEMLNAKLYTKSTALQKDVKKKAETEGYFADRTHQRRHFYWAGGGLLAASALLVQPGAFIAGIATLVTASGWRPLTDKGAEARDYLKGLKMYMKLAETERIRQLQSPQGAAKLAGIDPTDKKQLVKLYERLLPYAILFGIEKEWVKEFAALYDQPPEWYAGNWVAFHGAAFAASLSSFTTTSNNAFLPPSNSSSSGFSGGGSSGGGGGGGGGGGW